MYAPVVQAVIFLFEHSEKATAGFILNKPTEHTLGRLVGADALCPEFADCTLYLGGDVGHDTMHLLHGCSDIQVLTSPASPLFVCCIRKYVSLSNHRMLEYTWHHQHHALPLGETSTSDLLVLVMQSVL